MPLTPVIILRCPRAVQGCRAFMRACLFRRCCKPLAMMTAGLSRTTTICACSTSMLAVSDASYPLPPPVHLIV